MSAYITELSNGTYQINVPVHGQILTEPLNLEFRTRGEVEAWLATEEGGTTVRSLIDARRIEASEASN
jgi:hypothetical protein